MLGRVEKEQKLSSTAINFLIRDIPIHIINGVTALLPNHGITTKIRGALVRPFIKECGPGFMLAKGCTLIRPDKMHIGKNCYIAHDVWVNAGGEFYMGDNSIIGPKCVIATSKHESDEHGYITHHSSHRSISIGKGTWLAANVVVTDGVKIGDGVIVAAGAVVTRDVEDYKIVAGIPCKVIGEKEHGENSYS